MITKYGQRIHILLVILIAITGCSSDASDRYTSVSDLADASPCNQITPQYSLPCESLKERSIIDIPENIDCVRQLLETYIESGNYPTDFEYQSDDLRITIDSVLVDLNLDRVNEIFILAEIFQPSSMYHDSEIWIISCQNGSYILTERNLGSLDYDPKIALVEDLNNDGYTEVVIQYEWTGSACEMEAAVYGWSGSDLIDYIQGYQLPNCKGTIYLEDIDGDGQNELVFEGSTSSSVGGGVSRGVRKIFSFSNSPPYVESSELFLESNIIVHVLQDAQIAFDDEEYQKSMELYETVATDLTLIDFPPHTLIPLINGGFVSPEQSRDYARAFALFRLVIIKKVVGPPDNGAVWLDLFIQEFPLESDGGEFRVLANLFIEQIDFGKNPYEACALVSKVIEDRFPELNDMIGDWGYNNIQYHDDTFCPYHY
jgi:hypothetical protein